MANKTIDDLPSYGSQDTDKIRKDLLEITKNDGTYAIPTYGTGASRKITLEELKTALDIQSTIVNEDIEVNSGNTGGWTTPLQMLPSKYYRVNVQGANCTLLLPTFNTDDLNKVIGVYKGFDDGYKVIISGVTDELSKKEDCAIYICTNVGWLHISKSIDPITQTVSNGVTDKSPSEDAVFDALALKAPIASPTFTGTVTTPDLLVSNATASTPTFFDATKKLITTTAQLWGTWVQTWSNKATPVDADTIGFYNSASTFVGVKSTLLNFWTAYLLPKVQALGYLSGSLTTNKVPYYNGSALANTTTEFDPTTSIMSFYGTASASTNRISLRSEPTVNTLNFIRGATTDLALTSVSTYAIINHPADLYLQAYNGTNTSIGMFTSSMNFRASANMQFTVNNVLTGLFSTAGMVMYKTVDIQGASSILYAQGGVEAGGLALNASAILQADSTTKGFLPPRMTNTQRTNIVSPAIGLMVYCTDATEGLYIYKSTGWTFII